MVVLNDNKSAPKNQAVNDSPPLTPPPPVKGGECDSDADKIVLPTFELPPHTKKNGIEFYSATQVARILHVDRTTVLHWRKKGIFNEDFVKHGVYLYSRERVEQLKSVYHKDWTWGGYIPSPTCTGQFTPIYVPPPPVNDKQSRIAELVHFFNQLYGKIHKSHFAYLWTKQNGIFSFVISDELQREAMAKKAIELANSGVDIWHSVNTVYIEPTSSKRGNELAISYQIAVVVDIDIHSPAHKGDPSLLAADFDEAKSFLPFTPSLIIHSGYGLHAYFIFDIPIKITEENREDIKRRNNLLLDVIRLRANGKKIDGVGDLPRVLRTPCTFNYKLGTENAPMCYIVEDSGLRFTPDQIDEKLNALIISTAPTETQSETVRKTNTNYFDDNPDFKEFRVRRMLDFINPSTLTYDDWLAVGMTLKNIGMDCSLWENWSRSDERFKDGECQYKWNGFDRDGYDIGTLYYFAAPNGYDAQETFREWKNKLQRTVSCAKISSARKRLATDGSSHFRIHKPLERSCFSMGVSNDNTNAENLQDLTKETNSESTTPSYFQKSDSSRDIGEETPSFKQHDLMTTREVADFIGVTVSTVKNWRQRKLFGCYFFSADEKHGDTLYYKRERVEQLKSVYQFGILQNMYKLARRNPEPTSPDDFQKSDSSRCIGEETPSFRHREFFTVDEVADYFGVTPRTVQRWHKARILSEDMLGHKGDLYFAIDNVLKFVPPSAHDLQIEELKSELHSVEKALANFDSEKKAAIERLKNVDTFDSDSIFSDDVLNATAFAKLFNKKAFSDFKSEITLFNRKTKEKKASVNEWSALVRDKASEISSRKNDLLTRHNEILAQIKSLSFVANNDDLQNFAIPSGYSVSSNGVEKIAGESMVTVCRRPVIIKSKTYNAEEKVYKLELAYQKTNGKWKTLSPVEAATVFNRNKLVDMANYGLPVTSSNATALVDYLDAFNAENENNFSLTYTVPRCGWHNFDDKDVFIDPRRDCNTTDEDNKNINVVVDSLSQFANSLRQVGKLEDWKKVYLLAKKSPVARIMIAAAIAPILLKILGERNFLLYICAPTRAGKTTALYFAASAVGDEKMIRSFDATKNGLAGAAADVSDYAFLVDEKQVADNRLAETFNNLVYALANGIGRTKLNKDSTLRKLQDWRTIAIMTGETQMLSDNVTGGANTRLLTIVTPREILSADTCKEIRNAIKGNYGLVFPLVINKIFEIGFEKLRQVYQDTVNLFTAKYPELLNEYCRYMAIITLADALLNSALGINTVKLANDTTIKAIDDAILNAKEIFKLIPTTTEISDTAREKVFILGFIAQNQNHFIGGNVEIDRMQMIYGKLDTDFIYITVAALKKACADEGFDYRKLVSDLVEDGFFVPSDKIKKGYRTPLATVQKKIGKANADCYRIKRSIFDGDE